MRDDSRRRSICLTDGAILGAALLGTRARRARQALTPASESESAQVLHHKLSVRQSGNFVVWLARIRPTDWW